MKKALHWGKFEFFNSIEFWLKYFTSKLKIITFWLDFSFGRAQMIGGEELVRKWVLG